MPKNHYKLREFVYGLLSLVFLLLFFSCLFLNYDNMKFLVVFGLEVNYYTLHKFGIVIFPLLYAVCLYKSVEMHNALKRRQEATGESCSEFEDTMNK